ncbi:MAG: Eco57I restriction-modification methylase domain-containing protein, partial [Thermoanaerobaculaceae bacterium]
IFDMQFDVIIGNPPYQLSTSGSVESQAVPIYNKFVEQAIKLNPRFLVMITPARWFNGGFGLENYRRRLLNDKRIRVIHDYPDSRECFSGVQIKGGVCFFLWDRDHSGLCTIFTHRENVTTVSERPLLEPELSIFIRYSEAVSILRKVLNKRERSFKDLVSPRDPFGLNYIENGREIMFKKFDKVPSDDSVIVYSQGWSKDNLRYVSRRYITTRKDMVDQFKVFISKAYGAGESYPHQILNKPFLGRPGTCCNMTYLAIGPFEDRKTAENVISYISTRFFRFLVSLMKSTQNAYRQVYSLVPMQDFSKPWTDKELYQKYGLTEEEIAFIEKMIRPMPADDADTAAESGDE